MSKGLEVESVEMGSLAAKSGIKKSDVILSINGNTTRDIIDFLFYANDPILNIKILRDNSMMALTIKNDSTNPSNIGITPKMFKTKVCKNRCIFCFVRQLPKGLRKTLYIKDEDYRLSFLYGSYITLSNITDEDKERIVRQRLSPLYISVHCTDSDIRNKLLGIKQDVDIMDELNFFANHKIYMHTQIVLCPDYNDNDTLKKTLNDLCRLYPFVQSVAVVPVGLTMFASHKVRHLSKADALSALSIVNKIHRINKKRYGEGVVYAADELFIKAKIPLPSKSYYDEFPQYENGVGMITTFLSDIKKIKLPNKYVPCDNRRFIIFTGESFYPYLSYFANRLKNIGVPLDCVNVKNDFFGSSITVAGLLTGRDILKALGDIVMEGDTVIIPNIMLKEGGNQFLDDVTLHDIQKILKVTTIEIKPTAKDLVQAIGIV